MEGFLSPAAKSPPNANPMNKCLTFADEIEKVQKRTRNAMEQFIRNKRELKENLQPYLEKKRIVPSVLQNCGSCHYAISMKFFSLCCGRNRGHVSSQHQNCRQISNTMDCKENLEPKSSWKLMKQKKEKKWKLEVNSEELNCLFYGKELKTGSQYRQKYISDDEIRELKTSSILRTKMKTNLTHNRSQGIQKRYLKVQPIKKSNEMNNGVKAIQFLKSQKKVRRHQPKPKYFMLKSHEEHCKLAYKNIQDLTFQLQ